LGEFDAFWGNFMVFSARHCLRFFFNTKIGSFEGIFSVLVDNPGQLQSWGEVKNRMDLRWNLQTVS
jgi:hypothetical protein